MKITLFGLAGTGTSTVGKLLAEKLWYSFHSTGNIMRSWAEEAGLSIYEFEDKVIKVDTSFDVKLDDRVKDFWKENDDFIFESRLAWNFIPDSFKISLTCEDTERYRRIHQREWGDIETVKEKTQKREDELLIRYKEVYPDIHFPPCDDSFDMIIDGTNINPDEIVENIIKKINMK